MEVREYVDDYYKYYQDRWSWELKNTTEQHELYMRTRARRSSKYDGHNRDLLPDFYSIERDAAQFGYSHVEWTDFFGLVWEGKRGVLARAGAPDYQGSLYYYDSDAFCDDEGFCVSDSYDAYDNQPPEDTYTRIEHRGISRWIDTANVVEIKYKYIVNNHLFKDTQIQLRYEDGKTVMVYDDYHDIISGLLRHGKEELVKNVFITMNEHFLKLRDSDREEEREYYPGKTAEEMFLNQETGK